MKEWKNKSEHRQRTQRQWLKKNSSQDEEYFRQVDTTQCRNDVLKHTMESSANEWDTYFKTSDRTQPQRNNKTFFQNKTQCGEIERKKHCIEWD